MRRGSVAKANAQYPLGVCAGVATVSSSRTLQAIIQNAGPQRQGASSSMHSMGNVRTGLGLQALTLLLVSASVLAQSAPRIIQAVNNAQVVALPGNVHPLARPKYDKGVAPASLPMERMLLVLKRSPKQEQSLQAIIASLHNPKSPSFHKWLTPEQFGQIFGPAASDVNQITGWLQQNGFQVTKFSRGRTVIEFSGTAAQVQQAFHTQIHQYQVGAQRYWANASAPQIPVALTPVVAGVASLNNFAKHPTSRLVGQAKLIHQGGTTKIVPVKPEFSSDGLNYLAPGDFWTIYNSTPLITASSPIDGNGQTIAVAGRSDIASSDISDFRSTLLPAPYSGTLPFNQINNGPDPGTNDDVVENTLDVEWSSAVAPAATIDLVVSETTATTDGVDLSDLYIVDNNLAPVMSTSYALCEAYLGTTENQFLSNLWEQAAAQGITSMVAAGDNGSAGCDAQDATGDANNPSVATQGFQVNGLASTPFNIAVGGNELTDDSDNYWGTNQSFPAPDTSVYSYVPEAVWNESCAPTDSSCGGPAQASLWSGSGGASSCLNATYDVNFNIVSCQGAYPKPSWQTGVFGIPNDEARDIPDVSFTAASHDGYLLCYEGSCESGYFAVVGGTSAASPAFAGVMSLVNQKTGGPQGQAAYILYPLAANEYGSSANPNSVNTASCNASNGYSVGTSCVFYDVTTGTNAVSCAGGSPNCSSTTIGTYGVLTGYAAAPGYDQATGLGSVNIANLVNNWSSASAAGTTTTLSVTPTTGSLYGQAANVSITVTATNGSGTPTGDVALVTNSSNSNSDGIVTVTLTNGSFSGTVNSLPAGSYTVYARYAGNANYASSTSSGVAVSVGQANSATAVSVTATDPVTGAAVSPTTVPYGSNVVVAANLTTPAGLAVPTGSVVFKNGTTTVETAPLDGSGYAAYANAAYNPGPYALTAQYSGDHNYNPSQGSASFTVASANPIIKLISNPGIVTGSGTATLVAFVQTHSFQSSPTGTIVFYLGNTTLGSVPATAVPDPGNGASDATATFTVLSTMLAAGANNFTASYSGDANYTSATSVALNINYAATAVPNVASLTASPTTATVGETITLTATAMATGFTAPGGTVTFYDGAHALGRAQIVGSNPAPGFTSGTATLKVRLAPGNHSLTAVYGGITGASAAATSSAIPVSVTGQTGSVTTVFAQPDANNPADYDITAKVLAYGLTAPTQTVSFNEISVVANLGAVTLNPATALATLGAPVVNVNGPGTPFGMAIADFNGDGIPDIATSDAEFAPSTSTVYIGKGDGTFNKPVSYPTGYFPDGVVVADFNNDGVPDIAVTNQGDTGTNGTVSILLGNGDGTFQPQIVYQTNQYTSFGVAGDFNRDGVMDLAILDIVYGNVLIAFGNGDGTFTAGGMYPGIPSGNYYPYDLKIGDLNNDGNLDLVVVDNWGGNLGVLLGKPDGTFQTAQFYPVGYGPWNAAIGDMNNDGKPDLVVSNFGDATLGVLSGNGDGTFQTMTTYSTGGYSNPTVYLADMNGDGKLDVVAPMFSNTALPAILQVFLGNGDGTLQAPVNYTLPENIGQSAVVGDLNGDGTPDVVVGQSDFAHDTGYVVTYLNGMQSTAALNNVPIDGSNVAQQLGATYSGDTNYTGSTSAPITVNGSGVLASPQIAWLPSTTNLGAGLPIGDGVLDATTVGGIAGTFTYTAQPTGGQVSPITAASTLTAGNYILTATFAPTNTANYQPASASLSAVVGTPDYSVTGPSTPLAITAGQTGIANFTIASQYEFDSSVTFSCGTLPPGVTCSFSPGTLTGSGSTSVSLATTAPSATNQVATRIHLRGWWTLNGLGAVAGIILLGFPDKRRRLKVVSMLVSLCAISLALSCGSASTSSKTGGGTAKTSTTTALSSSSVKAASGSSVTLSAAVTSTNAVTGTVTFSEGSVLLGSSPVSGGAASITISSLSVGTHTITASYGGDANDNASSSQALNQVITGNSTVTITAISGSLSHSANVTVSIE
jgi:subtilase family serine protease